MGLGPYLAYDSVNYECTICDRLFCSESALYAHCRQTSRHQWCERCFRVFVSTPAKNTHLRTSSRHNVCSTCPQQQDFATGEELQDHLNIKSTSTTFVSNAVTILRTRIICKCIGRDIDLEIWNATVVTKNLNPFPEC